MSMYVCIIYFYLKIIITRFGSPVNKSLYRIKSLLSACMGCNYDAHVHEGAPWLGGVRRQRRSGRARERVRGKSMRVCVCERD